MKTYKVYMHICKDNGKVYIGQTNRSNIQDRFGKDGKRYYQCPRFGNAIKKHGWDKFSCIVLEDNLCFEDANYKERYYIKLYHSMNKDYGYNISNGGVVGKEIPLETREKISNSLKGRPPYNKGKHHSEETKRKISEKKKGVSIKNTSVWTEEMRKHQSEIMKGRKMPESAIEKLKKYCGKNAVWYGRHHTEETKEKLRQYKGEKASWYGRKHTDEYRKYMSIKVSGANNQAYGKHWYNDGVVNIFTYDCPIGFHKGMLNSKNKKEDCE